jgi:hypothetical protein
MILEKQKEAMIVSDGDEMNESIGMSLDLDSAQILMQMLSKNLYSDSIGSTIRECASNALDSHRRAGVKDPIVVSLRMNSSQNYEFSVEDFGIGLNDDDVKNIISKYGKSTKRNSNTELGMMGLGFKAPLAYSSSFYFICRKDGIERKYMMYEGEDTNTIDRLYERPTAERDGVKVIVPVKWSDREQFFRKMKEQLAYFEDVYFDANVGSYIIDNNFTIYRGEQFQYSQLASDEYLHICLDNVYYPIDFSKLEIPKLEFPVALRFSLTDGIFPTPNREAIRYTQEAKQMIMDRLAEMSDFFVNKYNDQMTACKTFQQVKEYYDSSKRTVEVIPGVKLNVGYLSVFSNIVINKPQMDGVKHLDLEKLVKNDDYILKEYKVTQTFNRGKFRESKGSWDSDVHLMSINLDDNKNAYLYSSKLSETKKAYLRTALPTNWGRTYYFIRKSTSFKLFPKAGNMGAYDNYYKILNLRAIDRKYWREAIVEFQKVIETITSGFLDLDAIVVPDSFLQTRRQSSSRVAATRREKMDGDIIVKKAAPLERYVEGKECKFVTDTWRLKDIPKMGTLVVYGSHDDAPKLDHIYTVSHGKQKLQVITLSAREMKVLEELEFKNVMSYSKFMEGDNKPFRRIVTAYLINELCLQNSYLFGRTNILRQVSKELADRLDALDTYKHKNYVSSSKYVYDAMLEVAKQNNLFDHSIYSEYLSIKTILDNLYFLNTIFSMIRGSSYYGDGTTDQVRIIVDLMKYHKMRVNLEHYSKPKLEEKVEEELLESLENQ